MPNTPPPAASCDDGRSRPLYKSLRRGRQDALDAPGSGQSQFRIPVSGAPCGWLNLVRVRYHCATARAPEPRVALSAWCPGRESNPHGRSRGILSPYLSIAYNTSQHRTAPKPRACVPCPYCLVLPIAAKCYRYCPASVPRDSARARPPPGGGDRHVDGLAHMDLGADLHRGAPAPRDPGGQGPPRARGGPRRGCPQGCPERKTPHAAGSPGQVVEVRSGGKLGVAELLKGLGQLVALQFLDQGALGLGCSGLR